MSEQGPRLSRRRFVAGVGALSMVLGAGAWAWLRPTRKGEHVSYTAWNNTHQVVEEVSITRVGPGTKHLFGTAVHEPSLHMRPSFGGFAYMADTGHTVPDEVEIGWRKSPREGQAMYRGDPVGPFRVKVRSRIPKKILKMIRQKGIRVELSFSIGQEPIVLCWRVRDFNQAYGTKILEQGGDNPACKG